MINVAITLRRDEHF